MQLKDLGLHLPAPSYHSLFEGVQHKDLGLHLPAPMVSLSLCEGVQHKDLGLHLPAPSYPSLFVQV